MRISDWSSDVCSSDLLTDRDCGNAGRGPYSPRPSRQAWETGVGGPLGSAPALPSRHAIVTRRAERSEERRVGKEWVSTCRYRWSPAHSQKKHKKHRRTRKPMVTYEKIEND